jgi:hypothetical protein
MSEPDRRAYEFGPLRRERAVDERSAWLVWLAVEPRLDAVRVDPRFAHVVARVWPSA